MKKAFALISDRLYEMLMDTAAKAVSDALKQREYQSFTGQTVTSYACGVYMWGALTDILYSADGLRKPVAKKVRFHRYKRLKRPYEGESRGVWGSVEVNELSGRDTSEGFLRGFNMGKNCGLVLTTGTEYSQYIENVRGLNVLTKSVKTIPGLLLSSLKPIV